MKATILQYKLTMNVYFYVMPFNESFEPYIVKFIIMIPPCLK